MADESVTPPGATYDVATDTVSGREYQLVKLVHGEDGGADRITNVDGLPTRGSAAPLTILDIDTELPDVGGSPGIVALTADTDVRGYSYASVYLKIDGPFTFAAEEQAVIVCAYGSNDNINWIRVPVILQAVSGPSALNAKSTKLELSQDGEVAWLNIIPINFTYLRLTIEPGGGIG